MTDKPVLCYPGVPECWRVKPEDNTSRGLEAAKAMGDASVSSLMSFSWKDRHAHGQPVSISYPYLSIARMHGADYGHVLQYLEFISGRRTVWSIKAVMALSMLCKRHIQEHSGFPSPGAVRDETATPTGANAHDCE